MYKKIIKLSVIFIFSLFFILNVHIFRLEENIVRAKDCNNCSESWQWACHGPDCDCCGHCGFWGSGCNTNPGSGASPQPTHVCSPCNQCVGSTWCGNDCVWHPEAPQQSTCGAPPPGNQPSPTIPSSYSCGASAKCDVVKSCSADFGECRWSCITSSNCFWCTPQCPNGWTDLGHGATCPPGATCRTVQCNECRNNTVCQQNPITGTPPTRTPTSPGSPQETSVPTPSFTMTPTPTPILAVCESMVIDPQSSQTGNNTITIKSASFTAGWTPRGKYGKGTSETIQEGTLRSNCDPSGTIPCSFTVTIQEGEYIYAAINIQKNINGVTYNCGINGWDRTTGAPPGINSRCENKCKIVIPLRGAPTATFTPTQTPAPNPLCDDSCNPNGPDTCGSQLRCEPTTSMCKNPACGPNEQTNCICNASTPSQQNPTNTPTKAYATVTARPSPTIQRVINWPSNPTQPQSWVCLSHDNQGANTSQGQVHIYTKSGTLPKNIPIYIVGCVQSGESIKCTTGNSSSDTALGIAKDPNHIFQMVNPQENPIRLTDAQPNINAIVVSKTTQTTNHTFYAVYYIGSEASSGSASSLTYSTFEVDQDSAKCTAVRWDPYGRIFDAVSLEPIPGIQVTVLDNQKNKLILPGLENPIITDNTGSYRFYAEEGTYFLTVRNTFQHVFTEKINIHQHYARAYRNIYSPMEPIVEKAGFPEQRDIPMKPQKTPYYRPVGLIHYAVIPVREEKAVRLLGQTTHPLTKVQFVQNDKVVLETIADAFGFYEVSISENLIQDLYPIKHRLIKADLTKPMKDMYTTEPVNVLGESVTNSPIEKIFAFLKRKTAQSTKSSNYLYGEEMVNPYPQFLKIRIKDKLNKPYPNAKIQVVLASSKSIYSETITNEEGVVTLNKSQLPIMPYFLFVIPSDSPPFEISAREFSELSVQ